MYTTFEQVLAKTRLQSRDYQIRLGNKALAMFRGQYRNGAGELENAARSVAIEAPTGCLVGDTEIIVNLGGKSIRRTMSEAYLHFHGGDPSAKPGECRCGCGERTRVPHKIHRSKGQYTGIPLKYVHGHSNRGYKWTNQPFVRAFRGEFGIGLHKISNIIQSGVKPVFRLTLADGKTLIGTACHQIMTNDGWIQLGQLTPGIKVMIDRVQPVACAKPAADKYRDSYVCGMDNHPFVRRVRSNKYASGYAMRVAKHNIIYEAYTNQLSINEYIARIRIGNIIGLSFVNPADYDIHHKDGNHYNNILSNLQLLTRLEHNTMHGVADFYQNFGNAVPDWSEVVTVEPAGETMTYDICCVAPHHNFVANGIVVHNSGKTPLALSIAKALQTDDPSLQVVWVTMRRNLLAQAERENVAPSVWNPDGKDINTDIVFLSMFTNQIPEHLLPENRSGKLLFIHDELVHDATATAAHLHNEIRPDYVMGMSAHPFRTDRVKLAFEKVISDAGIQELIQAGYLSQYEHFTIPEWLPSGVAYFYLAEPDRWGPSLCFFNTLDQCREFARLVNAGGRRCELVDASTDREEQINDLKAGKLDILVNCAILTEGFNFPDLKSCFVRDSWRGCTVQQGGRIFRPSSLYSHKQIIQSKDTRWPFPRTATPVQSWLYREDGWLTMKPNQHIEKVIEEVRFCVSNAVDTVPAFLKEHSKNGRGKRNKF